LLQVWKQSALEEGKEPELELQQRTVTVLKLTEGLGLTEAGIRVSEDINCNGQRAAATARGICEEILNEKKMSFLSCQTSLLCFFKISPGAHASPPVPFDTGDNDTDDPPAVQDEAPSA